MKNTLLSSITIFSSLLILWSVAPVQARLTNGAESTTESNSVSGLPEVVAYPGVTSGMLSLMFQRSIHSDVFIEIHSLDGILLEHLRLKPNGTNANQINLGHLDAGTYILQFELATGVVQQNITIQ